MSSCFVRRLVIPEYAVRILFMLAILLPAGAAHSQITKSSGGIAITISKIVLSGTVINIQFNAANKTKGRVYVREASGDETQKAFLGSGPQLSWPAVAGIELCSDKIARCANPAINDESSDLNRYSYIEPGDSLSFSFAYQTPSPASASDMITFNVPLIARYSSPDGNPQEAGPMQAVRQNFSHVPLNIH